MSPKILDYEEGRIKITAEAYCIPEIKALIDKYDMKAEPYLAYVHLMTAIDSPYLNIPINEKHETVVYDVIQTLGDFDIDEPLLKKAEEKLDLLYTSTLKRYYDSLKISIDKMSQYLKDSPIIEGKDGNLSEIIRIHKEGGGTMRSFKDIEKQVDEELKTKMRGKSTLGDY